MKKILFLICMLSLSSISWAQESSSKGEVPFQFTFITPLGTNGVNSIHYVNQTSLNVLGGVSRANTGIELGSIFNINSEYTKGVQLSGMINYSGRSEKAVQLSGTGNFNKEQNGGVMVSGAINTTLKGSVEAQVSGALNYAENAMIQVGGVVNVSSTGKSEVQLAGIGNFASDASIQIAGILNIAKNVKGLQLGLINISDTNEGAAIGLINIVKKGGKYEFEAGFGETLNNNISFKIGTNKMYSIFSTGINYMNEQPEYAYGFGLGTEFTLKDKWKGQLELHTFHFTENGKFRTSHAELDDRFDSKFNQLEQLKFTVSKEFSPHFKVFAGPTINVMLSDRKLFSNGKTKSSIVPYSIWNNGNKGQNRADVWVGFNAGVRF